MKRIALLTALIMVVLSFSFVLATEEETLLIAPAPETAEENVEVTSENEGEIVETTEVSEENGETEVVPEETVDVEPTENAEEVVDTPAETVEEKSNSTIIGAIIAIVIVVVVVALAALIKKK